MHFTLHKGKNIFILTAKFSQKPNFNNFNNNYQNKKKIRKNGTFHFNSKNKKVNFNNSLK